MGGTTNSQALRFPYVDEVINSTNVQNLATDIASKLDVQDVSRSLITAKPIAVVSRSANQAFVVNTDTTIIWDTINLDTAGLVNLGTQPTRITVPSTYTGLWEVTYSLFDIANGWTRTAISVMVTGVVRQTRTYYQSAYAFGSHTVLVNVPTANDYIEIRLRHAGGGTDSNSNFTCTAHMVAKT